MTRYLILIVGIWIPSWSHAQTEVIVALSPDTTDPVLTLISANFDGLVDGSAMTNGELITLIQGGQELALWVDVTAFTPTQLTDLDPVFLEARIARKPFLIQHPTPESMVEIVGIGVGNLGDLVVAETHREAPGYHIYAIDPLGERAYEEPVCHTVATPSQFIRGDCNGDLAVNIGDPIRVLDILFAGGTTDCEVACDANDDEGVNIADAVFALSFMFSFGPEPAPPYPNPGIDFTGDGTLTCNLQIDPGSVVQLPCDPFTEIFESFGGDAGDQSLADIATILLLEAFIFNSTPPPVRLQSFGGIPQPPLTILPEGFHHRFEFTNVPHTFDLQNSSQQCTYNIGFYVDLYIDNLSGISKYMFVRPRGSGVNPVSNGLRTCDNNDCRGYFLQSLQATVTPQGAEASMFAFQPQTTIGSTTYSTTTGWDAGISGDQLTASVSQSSTSSETIQDFSVINNNVGNTAQWQFYQSQYDGSDWQTFWNNLEDPPTAAWTNFMGWWEVVYTTPIGYEGCLEVDLDLEITLERQEVDCGFFTCTNSGYQVRDSRHMPLHVDFGKVFLP